MTPGSKVVENEVDLLDYIKILYKRRWLILCLVIYGASSAGIASMRQPEVYEASATFFPVIMSTNIKQEGFGGARPQVDIKDLIIAVLESRKMADKVTEELGLKKLWGIKNDIAAQNALRGATKVSIEQRGLIRLSVQASSAELAAKIANAYVDSLDYFNQQLEIGPQRNIVQVIDRATVPEAKAPRNTAGNVTRAAFIYSAIAICLSFIMEFIKKSDIVKRVTEG